MQNYLSTMEFAEKLLVKPESVRHSLCVRGHYLGVRPRKLPNGRLLWPRAEVNRVLGGDRDDPRGLNEGDGDADDT
ncbi:MAG: hypothetical protein JEZ11_07140 [Desulfobacterales bacterium]|nr:hypothetical protein [Desulfobacterales bacterium]